MAAGRRVVGAAGAHRVPAGVVLRASGDRVAAVLRRRRGRVVHCGNATRHRGGGAGVLRARHRAHRQGVGHRPVQLRGPRRRLPPRLVRHHRHDPDRPVGPAVQGRNPHGGTESVADRDRIDRLLRGDRGRRVFRSAGPARRTAHLARQRDRRPGPMPGAGAGGVTVRRDDQRGPVSGAGPRVGCPVRFPAGDPGGLRVGVVLVARRVPPRRRGDECHWCPAWWPH